MPILLLVLALPLTGWADDEAPRRRTFELTYRATVEKIPERAERLDLWLPLPRDDADQTIHRLTIDAPKPVTIGREPESGNRMLHVRFDRPRGEVTVSLTIVATRQENAGRDEPLGPEEQARLLAPEPLVPLDGPIRRLAEEATRGLEGDSLRARAIYEAVVGTMTYDKSGTGWGRGDALYACDAKRGNCTDFHALLIGMARSVGIPARFAIGLPLQGDRDSGEVAGYHCWAEMYVEGQGWIPVDASEAAKDPARRDYFFGHHDEDRLEFSRGRNLTLEPPQQGPPLNFFIEPYAEIDGVPHEGIDRRSTFKDLGDRLHRPRSPAPPVVGTPAGQPDQSLPTRNGGAPS
jgi:transglutaminase-like putative cysteine protease